jgi:hypothetical protein
MKIPASLRYVITVLTTQVIAGCGLDPVSSAPKEQLIVQAFLSPGAPVDNVRLTRTMDPVTYWEGIAQTPVTGAQIVLRHDGASDTLSELSPGTYGKPSIIVQAGKTYGIEIRHGVHILTAETTVPYPITTTLQGNGVSMQYVPSLDTLVFPREYAYPDSFPDRWSIPAKPLKVLWTRSSNSAGYQVVITARDTTGQGFLRVSDYDEWKGGDFRNAQTRQRAQTLTYPAYPDSLSSDLFWVGFKYQGDYDVVIMAMDQSFYYFLMSADQPGTGADYDTGVTNYVRGGLGVFGSYSADTVHTYVKTEWLPSRERP